MRVVAFGGGHGLGACLRALRLLRAEYGLTITAVVTVADDGGSSGRLRAQRGGLPPGDLRQALAALIDPADPVARDGAQLLQFRFDGEGELAGHAVGNLLITALTELTGDPVAALARVGELLRAQGRVLPMSRTPLGIQARIYGDSRVGPDEITTVTGQHSVAVSTGEVREVCLIPAKPAACPEAIEEIASADWLIFGPGSWYTSVIPHLLVPDLGAAILASTARRLVTLNLAVEQETVGLSLPDHLRALSRYLPGLRVDVVLADGKAVVGQSTEVVAAAESLGAKIVFAPVAIDSTATHDPAALADALRDVFG